MLPENSCKTKQLIFDAALRLFALRGYENVSVRTIADEVGIKAASIYNHYKNKEQLLFDCYAFYTQNRYGTRLAPEEYEPVLKHGTQREVFEILEYKFPDEITEKMVYSLLVIFSRIYTDPMARAAYMTEVTSATKYLKDFFEAGIRVGRFEEFNVQGVSHVMFGARLFSAFLITLTPGTAEQTRKDELDALEELIRVIPFKY